MASELISIKNSPNVIIKNSPCIITMDQWDNEEIDNSISMAGLGIKKNNDLVIKNGLFSEVGVEAGEKYLTDPTFKVIDARNLIVLPGVIDCHTHPVFAGSRAYETVLKSQGLSYEEIAKKGGGIQRTVSQTRESSLDALTLSYIDRAKHALSLGVVLWEAKTGYGLIPEEERKLLQVLYNAHGGIHNSSLPSLVPTYLGPHAASPEHRGLDSYIQDLIDEIPKISEMNLQASALGIAYPLGVDIFIERNYFTKEHGELWLNAALQHGLDVHIHADEFSRSGGCELAIELCKRLEQTKRKKRPKGRVLSVDHCQYATETDLSKLHNMGVTAVVLPATSFFSNISYVSADRMRASGVRVAISSDFNPGSAPVNNIWFSCFLALSKCGFTVQEIIAGITLNAAYALGVENHYGIIAQGRKASCTLCQGANVEDFFASPTGEHVRFVLH